MLQFGIRWVRPCKAWGWTGSASPHNSVCVDRKLEMSGRGRVNRRVLPASPTSNREQPKQVNEFVDIATAIRESAAAMCESTLLGIERYSITVTVTILRLATE
ncbi:hypothetical protein PIB30_077052 [Stylosanthes scabra]|uniref:Uncharacterized protein n=1 Tax=Stylosanthes scabra TaxID=79078 RepID=A0ABU6XPD3_9FABA|nr:hypothetical protein [Stylosanthes scabra]